MPQIRRAQLPMQQRQASFVPASVNAENRTVELVWTTGATVRRMDWWTGQPYDEQLIVGAQNIRMQRLNSGAPLLNSHGRYDLSDQIGVIERAWLDGETGRALVRFSGRADVDAIFQDVRDGIIRNVSVGYAIHRVEVDKKPGAVDLYRVVDWEPQEISLVTVPADAGSQVRGAQSPAAPGLATYPCEFVSAAAAASPEAARAAPTQEERIMSETSTNPAPEETTPPNPAAAPASAPTPPPAVEPQVRAASWRDISAAVTAARLPLEFANALEARNLPMDQVRAEIIARLGQQDGAPQTGSISVGVEDVEKRRSAASEALLHRVAPDAQRSVQGNPYLHMRLMDLGRQLIGERGQRLGNLPPAELATRVLTSSDFPYILADVANKTLRRGYETQPRTFAPWCRRVSLPDFKQVSRVQLGDAPSLELVREAGVITQGATSEARERYSLASYARMMTMTRQMLINDDLAAFSRIAEMFGAAAARLENDIVWGVLTANAAMNDSYALFSTDHANISTSSTSITETTLNTAALLLGKQTTISGNQLNLDGRFLLVPRALLMAARKAVAAVTPSKTADVNTFQNAYEVIAESRLDAVSATTWYMIGDYNAWDTLEYGYLEGANGPVVESMPEFDTLGVKVRCYHDFAAKAIDHRNMAKLSPS